MHLADALDAEHLEPGHLASSAALEHDGSASAAALGRRAHDRRGHDAAHALGLDGAGEVAVGLVDHERAGDVARRGGRRRRPTPRGRARASIRSAGPFSAAPATIGETATTSSRRPATASRTPRHGEDRADRHDRVRRARSRSSSRVAERVEHARSRAGARSTPSKRTPLHGDAVLAADEVLLEPDLALAGDGHACLDPVVGHRAARAAPSPHAAAISAVTVRERRALGAGAGCGRGGWRGRGRRGGTTSRRARASGRTSRSAGARPSPATSRRRGPSPSRG